MNNGQTAASIGFVLTIALLALRITSRAIKRDSHKRRRPLDAYKQAKRKGWRE